MTDQAGVAHPASPAGNTDPTSTDFAGDPTTDPGHLHTAASAPGTPSSGGYLSLTGAGETATPGDLTQAGGFTVNDSAGDGISLTSAGTITLTTNSEGGLTIATSVGTVEINTSGGFTVNDLFGVGITLTGGGQMRLASADCAITLNNDGGTNIILDGGTTGVQICTEGQAVGFCGESPVAPQASGGTVAGVIAALVRLGLLSS